MARFGLRLLLLTTAAAAPVFLTTTAAAQTGSMFYDSWAGEVGGGPDSAWGVENLTDPNNGNVHYTNITPSESSASNPTTLMVISDSTSPTGRALQMTILPSPNFATDGGIYDSAEISTKLSGVIENNVEYGHIEASIKVAGGPGTGADSVWPAFWMLGDNISSVGWPNCGEIDIMETKGSQETTNGGHIHGPLTSGGDYNGGSGVGGDYTLPNGALMYSGYNTYAIDWSPNEITWSVDGVPYLTETPASSNFPSNGEWVFNNHPFYLIFDICQGGPFASTGNNITEPLNMDIAYVEVTVSNNAPSSSDSGGAVPEPGTAALLAVGAFGLAAWAWRKRNLPIS
jgi:beta-glucanase (GH16 family)